MPKDANEKRRDVMLNGRQCAESIGISYNAFKQWRVPNTKSGRETLYSLQDVLKVYRQRVERELRPTIRAEVETELSEIDPELLNPVTLKIELDYERKRLTAAQADAQEEKNRMMRHEIAPFGFITFALASVSNALAGALDSLPTTLVRQAGIAPRDAEKVRAATASVGNQIASLANEQWVTERYDEYLAEVD